MEQHDNSVKRKRSSNFTALEKESLINIMQKYKGIIECKKTDGTTTKEKESTWDKIGTEFNAQLLVEQRPTERLKILWENLKRTTRKHFSTIRAEKFKTGGGKSETVSTDPIYVQVKGIIDGTCEPLLHKFDSDYLPEIDDIHNEQVQIFVQDDATEDIVTEDATTSLEEVRSMEIPSNEAIIDWSSWNPSLLKTPKSQALKISCTEQEASTSGKELRNKVHNLKQKEQAKLHKEIENRFSQKPNYKRRSGHLENFGLLAQAKLEYVAMLKKELIEKSQIEKEILRTQLVQEQLKVELLRKQLQEKST